jgi:hypothetical protein
MRQKSANYRGTAQMKQELFPLERKPSMPAFTGCGCDF